MGRRKRESGNGLFQRKKNCFKKGKIETYPFTTMWDLQRRTGKDRDLKSRTPAGIKIEETDTHRVGVCRRVRDDTVPDHLSLYLIFSLLYVRL